VKDFYSGRVLMLAYVNRESFAFMLEKGETCFWSRSRNQLWHKGATSGDFQKIKTMALDCENNSLLIQAEQLGSCACHTGSYTCYGDEAAPFNVLERVLKTIQNRAESPKKGSYTNYLLENGIDKICKKIGEESAETIIAAKNKNPQELTAEISDLTYHLLVLMHECGLSPRNIMEELTNREGF
jgi:phosphoribosyl-ATP pyrophosphohydrolase/phosphoribosyl-AMP cyclohydrolase